MKSSLPREPDPGIRYSKTGLRDLHRRGLVRLIFIATGVTLSVFATLQLFNGNHVLAVAELVAAAVLGYGATRVMDSARFQLWTYGYLVTAFSFFLYIIMMPGASSSAYVWVFIMPILSYLLLGRVAGFFLAVPFMLAGGYVFYIQLDALDSARVMIDLLNPAFCGVLILLFMHVYEKSRAEAQDKLVTMAETDSLTGLSNRSSFRRTLERVINECRRNHGRFALVLMDIDHFKRVNDTLGHDAGDEILRHLGQCLNARLRNTDCVGRLGGEEFGLILRDVDVADAYRLANELRERIATSPALYDGKPVTVTASFGIAYWPADAERLNELYQIADQRLYQGKQAGRNRVVPASDFRPGGAGAGVNLGAQASGAIS
ncbi:MAG: GGDEF domain-containing protein [Marinobacter sp.]|uniref:GGDEF domain-containing protein n=1 Tax=Marinobacter sp. TaxID=50741 RepID=UPI00299DADE3|nr:GGDEF domain-containing protein [Marinobacter sp.]MDX1633662.1 GGDEF domain-containing protein [Marinobacter sp.]